MSAAAPVAIHPVFGRLSLDALPLHEPIVVATFVAVVIGGPDGLDARLRARADLTLSFGAATLPHALVRILALEQVYRSLTILAGHPYHRGDPDGSA